MMYGSKPKQVGDLGVFRYVDADSYDPDCKEIFSGIIIDVRSSSNDGIKVGSIPAPIYSVMCSDGKIRNLPHWELFEPPEGFDPDEIDKGSSFQEVAGEEE